MRVIEDAAVCDLTPAVLGQTILALEDNVLRGMHAIHPKNRSYPIPFA